MAQDTPSPPPSGPEDLLALPPRDAVLFLQGAKAIMSGNGHHGLLALEQATLEAMQRHLFCTEIDLHALAPLSPSSGELEAFVERATPEVLERLSALWCILPIVDTELHPAKVGVLRGLVEALGHNVALADDIAALAERDRFLPKFRMFRRLFPRVFHVGILRGLVQLLGASLGLRDRALGRRYDALAELPEGTFGHALSQFYIHNRMTPPGRRGAYPYNQIGPHDAHHVLAGCDTSYVGEFLVLPFEVGSSACPSGEFLVVAMLQTHAGFALDPSVPPTTGLFDPDAFFREFARGSRVHDDLLAKNWDFWPYVTLPLAQARARLGITCGGGNVDAECPQWNGKDSPENVQRMAGAGQAAHAS